MISHKGYAYCKYGSHRYFEELLVASYLMLFSNHLNSDHTEKDAKYSQLTGMRQNEAIELVKLHGGRVAHRICQEGLDNSLCEIENTQH